MAVLLIGIGSVFLKASQDDDTPVSPAPPPVGPPERVAEELDIFKERSREIARRERQESKHKKKKTKTPPTISNMFKMTPTAPTDVTDGLGMISRGGYLAGKTFGRDSSIAPLEVMPYLLTDEHFMFADVRGFLNNYSLPGGNVGIGYRHLREDYNAWGGASVWYDADQTSTKLFQQVGLSFEALIQRFELRSNVYLPVSSSQTISNSISNAAIVGNQLLYGRNIDLGTALRGVDGEVGYSLPIQERHVIRGFVGGYHFEGGSTGGVNGFKARVEAVYNNGPMAQVMYTHDKLYGDNLMVGVTFQFPFGNNHPTSGWKQSTPSPFRYVERNYNVIVAQQITNLGNQVATDPLTGKAYVVEQVYAPPSGSPPPSGTPDGTSAAPFSTVAAAQAAGGNIIIVDSGSVLNQAVTLTSGQHLIGEGTYSEALPVTGGGSIQIPNLVQAAQPGGSTATPIFTNVTGSAITLASNTEVSGFAVSGTTGNGISGSNVSNVSIHDMTFLSTGGDAIHLSNSSGNVKINHVQITGASGNGIVLDGGTANISFDGTGETITAQGTGFTLSNLTGGSVNINNLAVKNTGGIGLNLNTVGTNVTIGNYSATQTTGAAVAITGTTGYVSTVNGVSTNVYNTYDFTGYTTITSPKAAGFTVNNTDAIINVTNLTVNSTASAPAVSLLNDTTSAITFASLTVNTNNAKGLYAVGLDTLVIDHGTFTTVNAPAIDIQSSVVNATLSSVSVDGGAFGISLAQSTGVFTIQGNGHAGSGGTILNTTNGVVINSFGTTNLNWVNFTDNGTAIQSKASSQLNLVGLQITGSNNYAIDSLDDASLNLSNSTLTGNGAINGGTIRVRADVVGTFQSVITGNNISDTNGTAIQYLTEANGAGASLATTISSNTIIGTRGNSPIIGANWNGPAQMIISNNTIDAYG